MLRLGGMDGNHPGTAQFAADGAAVAVALAAARDFAEAHILHADDAARLAIIVEELVANLVEHGGAPGMPVTMRLARRLDEIDLTLTDGGMAFDPRTARRGTAIPARGGGAGIALVLAWAHVVAYAREAGRNRLDLAIPLLG